MTVILAAVIFILIATASQSQSQAQAQAQAQAQPQSPSSSSPPPAGSCTEELVAISPCLGYISTEPNNMTETPTSQCCDALEKAFSLSGEGYCFCYLIKQPLIFGFPLNKSRVISLPSVCLATMNFTFLQSICSGSLALPPLHSITVPVITKPSDSGQVNVKSPPSTTVPKGNAENSSSTAPFSFTPYTSPTAEKVPPPLSKPTSHSSAVRYIGSSSYCWFLPEALITSAVAAAVFTHQ